MSELEKAKAKIKQLATLRKRFKVDDESFTYREFVAKDDVLGVLSELEKSLLCPCGERYGVHCTICRDNFAKNSIRDYCKDNIESRRKEEE